MEESEDFVVITNFDCYEKRDFTELANIGEGAEGSVWKGCHGKFGLKPIAFKELFTRSSKKRLREYDVLIKCKNYPNPYIIDLYGMLVDSGENIGYVMEYAEYGTLHDGMQSVLNKGITDMWLLKFASFQWKTVKFEGGDSLRIKHIPRLLVQLKFLAIHNRNERYSWKQIIVWIDQIVQGLQHLHKHYIIHRDLKPKNILMISRNHLKLTDFGASRRVSHNNSSYVGTLPYMAPEVLQTNSYSFSADIYSYGVVVWEITHRIEPYKFKRPLPIKLSQESAGQFLSELIQSCLVVHESKRPITDKIIRMINDTTKYEKIDEFAVVQHLMEEQYMKSGVDIPHYMLRELEDLQSKRIHSHRIPHYVFDDFKDLRQLAWGGLEMLSIAKLDDFGLIVLKQSFLVKTSFNKEIEILIENRHPNIVQIFGILWNGLDQSRYLGYVMEYIEGGDLHQLIHDSNRTYNLVEISKWIGQIARGLHFLHKHGIIHRNIKPIKILVAANQLKLAGFGIAQRLETSTYDGRGTFPYMAPEAITEECSSISSDIYSLAITIWEIFHRKKPYNEHGPINKIISRVLDGARPTIEPDRMDDDVAALIQASWQTNAENRPSVREIGDFFEKIVYSHEQNERKQSQEEWSSIRT